MREKNSLLRTQRLRKGWTQQELADFAQVSISTIERAERGEPLRVDICQRICKSLDRERPEELGLRCYEGRRTASRQDSESVDDMKRREALRAIGATAALIVNPSISLPHSWNQFSQSSMNVLSLDEEVVQQFERLTELCWNLLRGNDLPTVGYLLPTFLPQASTLAQQSSKYQKILAALSSQGYILAGLVAVLQLNHKQAEVYCKQALEYSRIAEDRNLEVAALKHLATKFTSAKYPVKTLHTYQEALPLVDQVSPLLRSRTYLGLALAYAQCDQKQEAFRYLGLAKDTFPEKPEDDLGFAYADCGISSLNHYGGLIYLQFNQPKEAWKIFAGVERLKTKIVVPERTIIEIVNCQAEAAVVQRDLELACAHVQAGVAGAVKLKSEKRFNDTLSVYKQMRLIWPHEQPVKALAELFYR